MLWETRAQFEQHWASAHSECVPCGFCGRRFPPRRVKSHESLCAIEKATENLVASADLVRARAIYFFQRNHEFNFPAGTSILLPRVGNAVMVRDRALAALAGKGAYIFNPELVDWGLVGQVERIRDKDLENRK